MRALLSALVAILIVSGCAKSKRNESMEREVAARTAYARQAAVENDAGRMLKVSSNEDAIFEEGFGAVQFDPPDDFHAHAFRYMSRISHVLLRTHPRLFGGQLEPMRLRAMGWVNEKVVKTHPVISSYVDGILIGTTGIIDDNGHWRLDAVLNPDLFRGREWVNLVLECNAVGFHWSDAPALQVIVLYEFDWQAAAGQ